MQKGGSRKKKIARSAVGSVDNLAAFVAPQNRTHLSGRHVKYQTRQKMKAPHTNWVSINDLGVVSKLAADKRAGARGPISVERAAGAAKPSGEPDGPVAAPQRQRLYAPA